MVTMNAFFPAMESLRLRKTIVLEALHGVQALPSVSTRWCHTYW
jgi:hypothetical protein